LQHKHGSAKEKHGLAEWSIIGEIFEKIVAE